ncbi:MAG TPA: glycogen debranching enzyme GlgX [Crenotrichaceae bacterium]|nr:glycogen debranching enzyme GlgX [Crenotrichaceae bacterium]
MQNTNYKFKPGHPYPPGANIDSDGVNFSIFSRHATKVELLLFATSDSDDPFQTIELKKQQHCSFFSWHVFVVSLPIGTWYAWRIDGPDQSLLPGTRFDPQKLLLDPFARSVNDRQWDRMAARLPGDNRNTSMRSVVVDNSYDWDGDTPLFVPSEQLIIYELHVGGFTRHSSSNVTHPGTFSGLIEKIPYLQELGITHVELLPVMAFDKQDVPAKTAELGLENYWGYSTHSFFSPHPGYCVTPEQGTQISEFCDLVKALHKAGIGIIVDVVFNHTAEAGADGPIINFKGIAGDIYYHLDEHDKNIYLDYTGCGNTVNANHPVVTAFIINCLEYWVRELHVDGFRFDLASALARGEHGEVLHDPPVLWGIELSEQLAKTKLIAEAWDAEGLYQVGSFPGFRWAEWNGLFRDTVRRFLRGEQGIISELATRISGSSDLYENQGRLPISGINFITCHDGFTLYDLFSYNEKHNMANGEDNRDGCSNNLSDNCGIEGDTNNPDILAFRKQQVKNAYAILLLSQGIPMLLAGDEFLNTQHGNNNTFCQNNEIAWLNWDQLHDNTGIHRFVKLMIGLRKRHHSLMRRQFLTGKPMKNRVISDITWNGGSQDATLWNDTKAQTLVFTLAGKQKDEADLHVIMNMSDHSFEANPPNVKGKTWRLAVDTSAESPRDIITPDKQEEVSNHLLVKPKSVVVFEN